MVYVFLGIAIVSEVIATAALKLSDGFTRVGPSIVTLIGYGVAFYFLSLTLKTMSTGTAYAIWSGIGIILTALVGWRAFGQKIDAPAALGMALIIAGVVVMNIFSKTTVHPN